MDSEAQGARLKAQGKDRRYGCYRDSTPQGAGLSGVFLPILDRRAFFRGVQRIADRTRRLAALEARGDDLTVPRCYLDLDVLRLYLGEEFRL